MGNDEAYVRKDGARWVFGTAKVERVVALEGGRLLLKSFKDRASGRELVPADVVSEEIASSSGAWKLVGSKETALKQGERQLDITVERDSLRATKSYVLYPGSSIIREWVAYKNAGAKPLEIVEPAFLNFTAKTGAPASLDFLWMSGGSNQPGSWKLKTEALSGEKPRKFDSDEPFPYEEDPVAHLPGDGINAKILLNDGQVWPAAGWQYSPNSMVRVAFNFTADVKAGDKLVFLVNMNRNIGYDTTAFDPTIAYADGESHTASKEFSAEQGKKGWAYRYLEKGEYIDLVYYPAPMQWRKAKDNATGTPFVGAGDQHPGHNQDVARVWTAPKAGRVRVTGSVCNTGNGKRIDVKYHHRAGTSSYAPWYALYSKDTGEGLFIGWDYFGHWASSFALGADGAVAAQLKVAGHKQGLAPGKSVATPKAFVGLFRDDLDNAGNECLDWQYRYLWDYTREGWFPAIRMLGYWMKGTKYGAPDGGGWTGGNCDMPSLFRKIFRVADLMRYCGADVYHRDWGWWDRAGDWNSPDFRTTGEYLRKHGMGQLIYAFLYTVDKRSRVAGEHPDWVIGSTLDMSRPEVVEFIKGQLDGFVQRWGDFEWRNDSHFTAPRSGDDTPLLAQDEGFRRVLRDFLDKYPACAFQAVNGGGNYGGYDYTRYCSAFSFSDGAVGVLRNYYASLLFPPDKTSDIPDRWDPNKYDKAVWRGLLCINFDMTGDTWDPAKLEGVRELIDIYHYLQSKGVVGRWVRVYRPIIAGDDPTMYLQRMSRDGLRGIIIPKHPAPGPVTIRPKGLLPNETYLVSFHESPASEERKGADLMEEGIHLEKVLPGELIYLNLPMHPGSKLDKEPPTPPSDVLKKPGENMGYPGVEITWKPGSDNNWVSYYEVFRNGASIDKVAKGTFYFDHSAGADPAAQYEIRTVDGAGDVSTKIAAKGPERRPAQVFDDAPGQGFAYNGEWEHQADALPAHAGTLSHSSQKGAVAELVFEGKKVLLFTKLGDNCGKAAVSADGAAPEVVDTYSADDIWGICIYRKELPAAGRHTLRVQVLGERCALSKDSVVHIDGVRVEPE